VEIEAMPGIRDFVLSSTLPYKAVHGLQPVTAAIKRAMGVYDTFESEARKIAEDSHLSPVGKKQKIQKFVVEHAHEIVRVKKAAEKAKANMAKRRTNIKLPPIDKTDAGAAAMRSELRNRIFQMSAGERKAFLPTADPMFWQAVLEAPNALTGIDSETRDSILNLAIEAAHPGALAKIEKDSEAIQLLEVASRVLAEHAAEVADLPNAAALDDFVSGAVPDTRHLEADAERNMSPLLEIVSRVLAA
jgi:hypothetical protein